MQVVDLHLLFCTKLNLEKCPGELHQSLSIDFAAKTLSSGIAFMSSEQGAGHEPGMETPHSLSCDF